MKKKIEMEWISGADIVSVILATEQWDIEAVKEDLFYAEVAEKRYIKMKVDIEELRRQDIELHSFIEDRYDIGPMEGQAPPILIGKRLTHGPYTESLVIDGYYRVAMAVAAGRKIIEAYVPETGTVYVA
ncbi:hypothetical protein RYH73_25890 [Olivibacter sp. CPCC 100613]|uniref:hypothetical protein n=1 Tax=Olivibacter sp. CPCC 100613 TaxID=3079931 RepID=UPI002FFCA858